MINRNDDQNELKNMILFCVAAVSAVLLLFLVVLYLHEDRNTVAHTEKETLDTGNQMPDVVAGKSNFVSGDLDFWDMYDEPERDDYEDEYEDEEDGDKKPFKSSSQKSSSSLVGSPVSLKTNENDEDGLKSRRSSSSSRKSSKDDDMNDGKHIKVTGKDGESAWYEISDEIEQNDYNFEDYLSYDNGFLKYSKGSKQSYTGISISNYDGKVDFDKVKSAGVDYVMIKVGQRGYDTGLISIDDKFVEYTQGASAAGLQMGMYFVTNAINDIEAVEEANYAVAACANYNIKYPIAIEITTVADDARTDRLSKSERTDIIKKFCDTVKLYGKTPVICATRDCLIAGMNLEDLEGYDIWLKDEAVTTESMRRSSSSEREEEDMDEENKSGNSSSSKSDNSSSSKSDNKKSGTSSSSSSDRKKSNKVEEVVKEDYDEELPEYIGTDYPYEFKMWQYSNKGSVNGINGSVTMNMSFVNYAER